MATHAPPPPAAPPPPPPPADAAAAAAAAAAAPAVARTQAAGWLKGYYLTDSLAPEPGVEPLRCVNSEAVWHISGARPGNGVDCVLDDSLETFWQSDGVAPHMVFVQFLRRTSVAEVCIYVDFKIDESYTPRKLAVRAGTTHHDLEEVRVLELDRPSGWVRVPVGNPQGRGLQRYLRTWYLQLVIYSMHQNGRDTHIRCLKILGPAGQAAGGEGAAGAAGAGAAAAAAAADAPAAAAPPPVAAAAAAAAAESWGASMLEFGEEIR